LLADRARPPTNGQQLLANATGSPAATQPASAPGGTSGQ